MLKAAYLQSEDWSFAAFLHKKLQKNEEKYPVEKAKGSNKKYSEYD